MRLYHFTAEHLLESIMKEGICKGVIPILTNPAGLIGFKRGNWLTLNPSFFQTWCKISNSSLRYDRTAVRLTIDLPRTFKVYEWADYAKRNNLLKTAQILGEFGDPQNWFISLNKLPPKFIKEVHFKKDIIPNEKFMELV